MIRLYLKAFDSVGHKEILRYLLFSALLAFAAFYGIFEIIASALNNTKFFENDLLERAADIFAQIGTLVLSWMLFPAFMLIIVSIFEEKVVGIIESKEYTKLLNPTPLTIPEELKLIIRNLLWNIAFLPVYLIPVVNLIVYYSLNSYLLGNTIFRFVAARKYGADQAKEMASANNSKIVFAGLGLVLLTTIPILNIIAPIFSIILMVHLVQSLPDR